MTPEQAKVMRRGDFVTCEDTLYKWGYISGDGTTCVLYDLEIEPNMQDAIVKKIADVYLHRLNHDEEHRLRVNACDPERFTLDEAMRAIAALEQAAVRKVMEKDGVAQLEHQAECHAYANCLAILSGVNK